MAQKGKSTLLQCFSKNNFAADVARSKCLQTTSSNAPFCTHYADDVNYCSLITVTLSLAQWENVNVMLELQFAGVNISSRTFHAMSVDDVTSQNLLTSFERA